MTFLDEQPGTGKGDSCSKYRYLVDVTGEGQVIALYRPARLNKGFDFEVVVEGMKFGNKGSQRPSHKNLMSDLTSKRKEPSKFNKLKKLIAKIYDGSHVTNREMRALRFRYGWPTELTLKVIKWLFIEQDVTYWNWSGRAMLYTAIKKL